MITFSAITPHPPIIIPGIGKSTDLKLVKNTIKSMEKLADEIAENDPETIIIVSPHALVHQDKFAVYGNPEFHGSFAQFGAPQINFQFKNDLELADKIVKKAKENGINAFLFGDSCNRSFELDHGEMVPFYYLTKNLPSNINILPIAYSFQSRADHFAFGQIINKIAESQEFKDKNIALIASGDMSHRLFENSIGKKFDQNIIEYIKEKNTQEILEMDEDFVESAGECGYRSILIALGVLDKLAYKPEILSYEGPFGVGYLVANFRIIL